MLKIGGGKEDWDELCIPSPRVVDLLGYDMALPANAKPSPRLFNSTEAALVGLRANHKDKVRFLDLSCIPARPALRRAYLILVEPSRDPVVPQAVAERQDPVFVLHGVVAVAQKNLWGAKRLGHG
jgi:hypothetical protein